jgi:predicted DCC family thiol-disulfide oxidoreductase YuxK
MHPMSSTVTPASPDQPPEATAPSPRLVDAGPVVLFDGVCSLCSGTVQWLLARDHAARFRFAALESEAAQLLLTPYLGGEERPDSLVLIDADGMHLRSDAALRIARGLGGPWALCSLARVVPRALRDAMYRLIARNRYAWFGRKDQCFLPSPAMAGRFLDSGESR